MAPDIGLVLVIGFPNPGNASYLNLKTEQTSAKMLFADTLMSTGHHQQ